MIASYIADNVKRILQEKGIKQKHVGEKAGYNEKTFSAMLNGRKIITDVDVLAIATVLNVTPNDLFAKPGNTNTEAGAKNQP